MMVCRGNGHLEHLINHAPPLTTLVQLYNPPPLLDNSIKLCNNVNGLKCIFIFIIIIIISIIICSIKDYNAGKGVVAIVFSILDVLVALEST